MKELRVKSETRITCPLGEVYDFATEPNNAPLWYKNIKSVRRHTNEELKKGLKSDFIAHFLGRKLSYTYEIIEMVPKRKFVMESVSGPFPMRTIYLFEALNGEMTKMTLINKGKPRGFFFLFVPIMAAAMKMANNSDLRAIKRILEA